MIKINRLCRKLVENGFGDIKVKIRENVILSVRSILMNGNETLKKLIEDVHFVGFIELYEECDEIGYYEMEKYYGGGDVVMEESNVCEILLFCLCYKDDEIYFDCLNFIKNNINDEILLKLIHICNLFPNSLKEIED